MINLDLYSMKDLTCNKTFNSGNIMKTIIKPVSLRYLIIIVMVIGAVSPIEAQKRSGRQKDIKPVVDATLTKAHIQLSARYYGDSIVLRWAVDKSSAWRALNEYGYIVERLTLDADNRVSEDFKRLTDAPVKPWTYEQWGQRINKEDDYAVIAAQTLYGESFDVARITTNKAEQIDNMADEARMRHAFAMLSADISVQAANGLGLRLVDKDVKEGNKYIYRVHSIHQNTSFTSDTALFVIGTKEKYNVFAPQPPTALEDEHRVTLDWDKENKFSAYLVQRSGDNGKTYVDLTERPYLQLSNKKEDIDKLSFSDTLPGNYKTYYYRIAGITSFGDVSPWSKPVEAMGVDRTPPEKPRIIKSVVVNDENNVKITWEIDAISQDMKGFYVGRGSNVTGPFTPLHEKALPNGTREYIDKNPVEHKTNYYVVASVDTAKNISQSMPAYVALKDLVPPAKPIGLSGEIDTNGLVKLAWPKGKEPDLNGYRVYYSNRKNSDFHALTGTFQDTTFTDTINLVTLDELIYYRIVAVDINYNNSEYSDIIELKKPDVVNPVAPVLKKYRVTDSTVYITWATSSSKDVTKQLLYRKDTKDGWQVYKEFNGDVNEFTDDKVKKENTYEYKLVAVDDAGLVSEMSKPLVVRVFSTGMKPGVNNFTVKLDKDSKSVILKWDDDKGCDCSYLIYRSINGNSLQMLASSIGGSKEYVDTDITSKGTYTYAVKVVNKDGDKSQLSESKKIEVQL